MKLMKLKCVLFDFDGVIVDSENEVYQYLKQAFLPYGVRLSDEDRVKYIGTDGRRCIQDIIDRNHLTITVERLLEEKMRLGSYYEDSDKLAPMPGIRELLEILKRAGIKTGLVSSTRSRLILTALNRLNLTSGFDVIICGDMVKEQKPSSECYRKALAHLNMKQEECLVFEDSPSGIRAAQKAGIFVVGYKGSEILQDTSAADIEIRSFYECFGPDKLEVILTESDRVKNCWK
jgi:beta-phosphoglucomutase